MVERAGRDGEPDFDTLTVRDVVARPELELTVVSGTSGLDRPVRWAHPTELLHPEPYLRAHEIVLTVGSALTSPMRARTFARAVASKDASAIGFGVGDVTVGVPAALSDECERIGMALFSVPHGVPFMRITEWLAELRARASAVRQERAELGRLLELIRQGFAAPAALGGRLADHGLVDSDIAVVAHPQTAGPPVAELASCGLVGVNGDRVTVLTSAEGLDGAASGGACGIGGPAPLEELPRILAESWATLELARRHGRPVGPRELATFEGLLQRMSADQLAPFHQHVARPLLDYDLRNGTHLLTTLRVFLRERGSLAVAARDLHLHVNSLRGRLGRIREVTGQDPTVFGERVALALAVAALDRRGHHP